ncbi:fimbrillin family protein [Bacteroides helcogenes]|uniref:GLUG domain protein n=1 Tax=Bacteroides helcogenes (strain ATCC 35417 / DSM 20613 / JCM 6297 / CCUG 15421 / P 36-108) TaxID=693979 RepID=E6SSB7_BACT6|nr:fimbrillin family protein [Bacteroides helcogenes]ADV45168.1 hypothetical protein Bache_3244 [Bacteroides helcogenes P 36-108]MDY5238727.1 fimbrillin family protein [Bacteroides helcogenes]
MKMTKYLGMAFAIATLAACSNEDELNSAWQNDPTAVKVNATVGNGIFTRSNPLGADEAAQKAFNNGDAITISANEQAAVTYTFDGTSWTPETNKYLKWEDNAMDFTAYYPTATGVSATAFTLPTDQTSSDKITTADYMTFSGSLGKPSGNGQLTMEMERKTARVIVKIEKFNDEFTSVPTVADVKIKSGAANYTASAASGAVAEITPFVQNLNADAAQVGTTYTALVIPTDANTNESFITMNVNSTASVVKGIPAMEAGKSYTYNMTIGKDGLVVGEVIVSEWLTGVIEGGEAVAKSAYSWYDNTATTLNLSTPDALAELSKIVSGDAAALAAIGATSAQSFAGKTITLENNIDLTGVAFSPIGDKDHPFKGIFEGNGNMVSGLNIDITNTAYVYCGFFGRTNNAIIRNLSVSGSVKVTGNQGSIGGIVGDASGGTILNCSFNGTVTGASCTGGIVGYANAADLFVTIQGCYSNATVKATGSYGSAGGLVGNCYGASPKYVGINACYSAGSIEGTYVGGLVGTLGDGTLSAKVCYTTAAVKGTNAGAAFGNLGGYGVTCTNVYFINSTVTEAKASGTVNGDCTSVTATFLQNTGVTAMNNACVTYSLPYTFEVSTTDSNVPLVIVKK